MSQNGRSLISALNQGDFEAVQRIHLSDSDLKIFNHHVHELFERAIGGKNLPLFNALLEIPRIRISGPDYCAIRHASELGEVEYLERLEGLRNLQPSLKDKMGRTALHLALGGKWNEQKGLSIARILLSMPNINVNARNSERKTPLHFALERRWYSVADLLMDHQANPHLMDANGVNPIALAGESASMPFDLFIKILNAPIIEGADDEGEWGQEEDDPEDPYAGKSEEEMEQERFKQMNAHKQWEPTIPDQNVDLTDPAPLSDSSRRQAKPITPDDLRAVDPIAMQQPSLPYSSPVSKPPAKNSPPTEPIKAAPREPAQETPPPTTPVRRPASQGEPIVLENDETDFLDIMGVPSHDQLPQVLTREYLLSPADDNARWRLHRAPVIEQLESLNDMLVRKGQGLRPDDFRRTHPSTGSSLWHVAAATGHFETAFRVLDQQRMWPRPDDFNIQTEVGKTITDVLEDCNRLSGVLHSDIWTPHPQLLAALLAQLPASRQAQFSSLITRTNLLILHS